jgi:hypothetical protein
VCIAAGRQALQDDPSQGDACGRKHVCKAASCKSVSTRMPCVENWIAYEIASNFFAEVSTS